MTNQLDVRLKDGNVIAAGTATVSFVPDNPAQCFLQTAFRPEPYRVRIASAFRAPSMRALEKWNEEGIAKSILGKRVEPDGWDDSGSPSWMLAMGLI